MHLIVSTKQTQGQRASDFSFVDEDEPLMFTFICDTDKNNPDPDAGCGCSRSLGGMICQRSTTTFKVIDSPMTRDEFVNNYVGAMQDAGFLNKPDAELVSALKHDAKELLRIANSFAVGDVLELRKDEWHVRPTFKKR